jgi:long-subunit acyl-CoA synthetase (AMP-forming)
MTDRMLAELLTPALATGATPRLIADGCSWSGPALLRRADEWAHVLRRTGLGAGDRLLLEPMPPPEFVAVLLAALELRCTLIPCAGDAEALRDPLDARARITGHDIALDDGDIRCLAAGAPIITPVRLRTTREARSPDVRVLLRTSGTTGTGRWIALSDRNIATVLASHVPVMDLQGARLLSTLPWHHVFGLVIDLCAALAGGATVIRAPALARDAAALAAALHGATHFNAVPLTIHRLAQCEDGRRALLALRGGAVGGAAVRGLALEALLGTRLRVGYGQTEAAPGICFGEPGAWRAGTLGRPLGCEVRLAPTGELEFRGTNACIGEWRDGRFVALDPDRWVATGDLARREDDGTYTLTGRVSTSFKLANGRLVEAAAIEEALRMALTETEDVVVASDDGLTLDICCCLRGVSSSEAADARTNDIAAPDAAPLTSDDPRLVNAIGPLARLPRRLFLCSPSDWPRTPKGDADRRALAAMRAT